MRRKITALSILLILSAVLSAPAALAYWVADGAALCQATGDQSFAQMTSDGAGGAFVTWIDGRSGTPRVYAQRVSASGVGLWAADGVAICTASGNRFSPKIVADGAGGAVITWQDQRAGNNDIYAQRVNASGAALWAVDGVGICTTLDSQYVPCLVSDSAGGAIVTWYDDRNGGFDLYAQRVNGSGSIMWGFLDVALCTATGDQSYQKISSDGAGGAIVAWSDSRSGTYDIYASRISATGALGWTANGVALCTATGTQGAATIVSDGAGGAIVAWFDARSGAFDIYAQKVSTAGVAQWANNGVPLCTAAGNQQMPAIVAGGSGGAIVTWQDNRSGAFDIYAQMVNSGGNVQWAADGVAVCAATGDQSAPQITSDGAGGAIVVWNDGRSGATTDVYAQLLNTAGVNQWPNDGAGVCLAAGSQNGAIVAADGAGGAVVAWLDSRIGAFDVYAQAIDHQGRGGFLAPSIRSIRDVPGDQGKLVNLAWYGARSDVFMDGQMSYYSIWRAIDAKKATTTAENRGGIMTDLSQMDRAKAGPVVRVDKAGARTFFWELIQTVDAMFMPAYGKPVPTLFDSTAVCRDFTYYQVVAHTASPTVFWKSEPDSGYSVDNLAPGAPLNILAGYQSDGVILDWDNAPEADFRSFLIYRGTDPGFVPSPSNLVREVVASEWTDTAMPPWGYHYKIVTVDKAGNESPPGSPQALSDVRDGSLPTATCLLGAAPNPFNPATKLSFVVSRAGHTRLSVYDAAGRLIVTLVDEPIDAGRHEVIWDGRNAEGRAAASGVYLYRLVAGDEQETRRMVLIK